MREQFSRPHRGPV